MSITRLPSGRFRAQIWHQGRNVSVPSIIGGETSYRTKTDAKKARDRARLMLGTLNEQRSTVKAFHELWTTDPLYQRPKVSTNVHNRERTKAFAERYGALRLDQVTDQIVGEWLAGGKRNGTIPALRAMFNDAASAKAGRLIASNPFAGLGVSRGPGRRHQQPPSEEMVWSLISHARRLGGPSFAAWLQVAAFTGMRPGELDALRWDAVDFTASRIRVREQWSAPAKAFTLPKNGRERDAPLTQPARAALLSVPRDTGFCFVNYRGQHFTASARAYHWKAVRAAAGWRDSLYLATRHFAGAFMTNQLGMPAEDVAIALGHTDGGLLVRQTYGHRDQGQALDRVVRAYEDAGKVVALRVVEGEGA